MRAHGFYLHGPMDRELDVDKNPAKHALLAACHSVLTILFKHPGSMRAYADHPLCKMWPPAHRVSPSPSSILLMNYSPDQRRESWMLPLGMSLVAQRMLEVGENLNGLTAHEKPDLFDVCVDLVDFSRKVLQSHFYHDFSP